MLGLDLITSCSLVIALGGLVYGVDTGIVATTIAHDSFKSYMYGPGGSNAALTGAIVSCYYAGNCVGSFGAGTLMDKWGRKNLVSSSTLFAIIGTAIQAGSINVSMMIVGRAIAGLATGALLTIVPLYIAELAPPENRAYLVALKGLLTAIGYLIANWIGYAGSFAVGDAQWRIPLAMQILPAVALLILTFFLPDSPRWLVSKDRHEDAHRILSKLHSKRGEDFISSEMSEIREQLALEAAQRSQSSWTELFSFRYAHRLLLACFILNMTKLSGGGVVQNYQSLFYVGLGFEGRTVLLISGCYGFMGVIGQVANMLWVSDKWPRVRTMCIGSAVLATFLVLLVIMSRFFGDGSNTAGAAAGIAFIFLYSGCYAIFFNSTVWVIVAEIFPQHLRGNGNSFAVFSMSVTNIWLSQITPIAFESLAWKFYFVFIALNFVAVFVYWFWLPETNQLTLEEVAGAFGDDIVRRKKLGGYS
ncbi:related to sugar transport protein STP1 [Cephalotrichum gorgonifer]|uniref:Related to sugar transport protein STP1 n=1 Tax=Cephalotrichum gorgonifer TaxID=2041049 RepID=A0AAE8N2R4_9PEZI|nr:related to sugar transport protein STP1 [Cephalotrichum gorgonifer]